MKKEVKPPSVARAQRGGGPRADHHIEQAGITSQVEGARHPSAGIRTSTTCHSSGKPTVPTSACAHAFTNVAPYAQKKKKKKTNVAPLTPTAGPPSQYWTMSLGVVRLNRDRRLGIGASGTSPTEIGFILFIYKFYCFIGPM
jgi:hypothetical protein